MLFNLPITTMTPAQLKLVPHILIVIFGLAINAADNLEKKKKERNDTLHGKGCWAVDPNTAFYFIPLL